MTLLFAAFYTTLVCVCGGLLYHNQRTQTPQTRKETLTEETKTSEAHEDDSRSGTEVDGDQSYRPPGFAAFQRRYLALYCAAMFPEWVQGGYVYAVYKAHGMGAQQIALLYATGFLASCASGLFAGALADRHGHRHFALLYAVGGALDAALKLSPCVGVQALSSALSGVCSTLLYTVFDAWMVSAHAARRYPPRLLPETFARAMLLNSVCAVLSGVAGSALADSPGGLGLGVRAPFALAAALLVLVLVPAILLIMYQNPTPTAVGHSATRSGSSNNSDQIKQETGRVREAWNVIKRDRNVQRALTAQALFETAIYMFVMNWNAVVHGPCQTTEEHVAPLGWIYSAFMLGLALGSQLFTLALRCPALSVPRTCAAAFCAAAALFLVVVAVQGRGTTCAAFAPGMWTLTLCFTFFETCCGVFYPAIGAVKGALFPGHVRTTLLGFGRVAQNVLILTLLWLSTPWSRATLMLVVAGIALLAALVAFRINVPQQRGEGEEGNISSVTCD